MHMKRFTSAAAALALAGATALTAGAFEDARAAAVLNAARGAIGDKKLEGLRALGVEAALQRNMNEMQMTAEVEIAIELPDKYVRSDQSNGPMPPMSIGFNGDVPIRPANAVSAPGGGMIIRFGPGGPAAAAEKLTPEEQERTDRLLLRNARVDISRLMLGWFAMPHPALPVTYAYAGEAESPDGKADVIDVKDAEGFAARLFVDRDTRLPLMVTYQGPQPRMIRMVGPGPGAGREGGARGRTPAMTEDERRAARETAEKDARALEEPPPAPVEFALYFDDWREVGGLRFPHKIRRAMAGTTNEEWTVTRVRVNPKFDRKKFQG